MRPNFGELIRDYRKEAGISQEALAIEAAVGVRTIRNLETEGDCSPKMRRLLLPAINRLRIAAEYSALRLEMLHGMETLVQVSDTWLDLPDKPWLQRFHGPGALLTADYRVVPFHGAASQAELGRLVAWCREPGRLGIRVYKGQGGMGKTRLALELCKALRDPKQGPIWTTGFARLARFPADSSPWETLPDLTKPLLVVVDYAGEPRKTRMVAQLLRHLDACPVRNVRLLFLERDDLWLDRVHEDRAAREVLTGPLLSRAGDSLAHQVAPVAVTTMERAESFRDSAKAFNEKLQLKAPLEPSAPLIGSLYERVLYLHMQALLSVMGKAVQRRDAILRHMLAREREYWHQRMIAMGLSGDLLPAIEMAVYEISLRDGVETVEEALRLLGEICLMRDLPKTTLVQIARLLRAGYPEGESGLGPLRPDELRNFLTAKFLKG